MQTDFFYSFKILVIKYFKIMDIDFMLYINILTPIGRVEVKQPLPPIISSTVPTMKINAIPIKKHFLSEEKSGKIFLMILKIMPLSSI